MPRPTRLPSALAAALVSHFLVLQTASRSRRTAFSRCGQEFFYTLRRQLPMSRRFALAVSVFLVFCVALPLGPGPQHTLGGIPGQVTDASGSAVAGAAVTAIGEQTGLS